MKKKKKRRKVRGFIGGLINSTMFDVYKVDKGGGEDSKINLRGCWF